MQLITSLLEAPFGLHEGHGFRTQESIDYSCLQSLCILSCLFRHIYTKTDMITAEFLGVCPMNTNMQSDFCHSVLEPTDKHNIFTATTDDPMEPVPVNSDVKERLLMPTIHPVPDKITTKLPKFDTCIKPTLATLYAGIFTRMPSLGRLFDAISWKAQALYNHLFSPSTDPTSAFAGATDHAARRVGYDCDEDGKLKDRAQTLPPPATAFTSLLDQFIDIPATPRLQPKVVSSLEALLVQPLVGPGNQGACHHRRYQCRHLLQVHLIVMTHGQCRKH